MPEQRGAFDVGFADFVAVLLVETLESIVAAHTSQEERLASLQAAATLTEQEFAQTGIDTELVDATAAQLFPDGAGGTLLVVGGPVPDEDALQELEVSLERPDTDADGLTQTGVDRLRQGLALYVARRQLAALREAASRGVPRVLVEGGTLRAKLNFTAVEIAAAEASDTEPGTAEGDSGPRVVEPELAERRLPRIKDTKLRRSLLAWNTPLQSNVLDSIRRTRLMVSTPVTPADGSKPEETNRAEVFGEVEIRFRMES